MQQVPVTTTMFPQQTNVATIIPVPQVTVPRPVVPMPFSGQQMQIPAPPQIVMPPAVARIQPTIPMPTIPTMATAITFPQIPTAPTMTVMPTPALPQMQVPTMTVIPTPTLPQMGTIPQPTVAVPTPRPQGGMLRQFGGGVGLVIPTARQQPPMAAPVVTIVEETGVSILTQLIPVWNGTSEQVQQLAALQYDNGNYIIDANRRDIITEIVGMLKLQGFEDVIDFLTDAPNPEYVLWDQSAMDEGRIKVAREIIIQQAEEVGVQGVGKCRYCPSTELVFATKQLRGGDEPMTIFVRCVMCHKQWRQ